MKKLIWLLCFFFSIQASEISQKEFEEKREELQNKLLKTSGLLVFLDDSELKNERLGGVSHQFLNAVFQNAGPIIASYSLLNNIVDIPKSVFSQLTKFSSEQRFENFRLVQSMLRNSQKDSKEYKSLELDLKYLFNFETEINNHLKEHWIIKLINPSLVLLIPKDYLENERKIKLEDIKYNPNLPNDIYSPEELKLGLKVNHMQDLDNILSNKNSENTDYFINSLHNIFVIKPDYEAMVDYMDYIDSKAYEDFDSIPTWVIYISGHGLIYNSIVSLSIDQFKKFLNFLETKINTKMLVYNSCFASGVNNELIYKDLESVIQKTYPFAIVTQSLTDTETTVRLIELMSNKPGQKEFGVFTNFKLFLNKINNADAIDYEDTIKDILSTSGIHNIPQIKLPNLPWFSILSVNNEIVSIGNVMSKSRTKPLNISTYFAKKSNQANPKGILLFTNNIPFEIILNQNQLPVFVSMIPGPLMHYIKQITFKNNFSTITRLGELFSISGLRVHKSYLISEINMNDLFKYENVIIDVYNQKGVLYYTSKDGMFVVKFNKNIPSQPKLLNEIEKKEYQHKLEIHLQNSNKFPTKGILSRNIENVSIKSSLTQKNIQDLKAILEKNLIIKKKYQ